MRIAHQFLCICIACLAFSACTTEGDDMGIVAQVNGSPIYLSQLEFQHDLLHMDGTGSFVPTVEALRGEYGTILGDLIVLEMVSQELESRGLGVTDEEVAEEEQRVRADYPDDTFEQVLVEEYIDLASWRERLRYHRALQKFYQLVLRPRVKVDYQEAEEYYRRHIKEFQIPETLRVLVVRAGSKKLVADAVGAYRAKSDPEAAKAVQGVSVHEMTVRQSQLSSPWLETLKELPPGEASQTLEEKFGYEALILLERLPSKLLDPSQAYPLVEKALLEKKLNAAFEQWLEAAWASAEVRVSAHLLPQDQAVPREAEAVEPEASPIAGEENADALAPEGDPEAEGDAETDDGAAQEQDAAAGE